MRRRTQIAMNKTLYRILMIKVHEPRLKPGMHPLIYVWG